MLIMSIPKELRTPENMAQLRENAEKLQTHYDVRATFLDILKVFRFNSTETDDNCSVSASRQFYG